MIPAAFEYVRAGSVDEAVSALSEYADDAKVLAGGHSLLPLMRLRLAAPGVLVDIGRIPELRGVREEGDRIVVGATTTHYEVMRDEPLARYCAIVPFTTETIGDPQVRHRGTHGGSLAHGDAAGDLPAVALACEAEMVIQGPGGRRTVPAAEFFVDYLQTAVQPDEVLVEVRWPKFSDDWGYDYQKFGRAAQAWAIVGACALVRRSNGRISEARVGLTNMGSVPQRARATEGALNGAETDATSLAAAAEAADQGTDPPTDLNAKPDFRRHLARVLTRRALEAAAGQ
jgi:aerobic carbon-monoxide dehydrogenase medium subunit